MSKIDYSKIFIKDACPTSIGGQAVMEGVMMQGPDRIALAMRLPSGELYLRTKRKPKDPPIMKVPMVRGVVAFVRSLTMGMGTLMESADILEAYAPEVYAGEPGKLEAWMDGKFGKKATWNIMMTLSVIIAFAITIVGFVIFPTWVVNYLGNFTSNAIVLNLVEGILRIILFVLYVLAIRKMEDIKTLFRYHGAEHKSIHCFENNLELTPDNADSFYTLHPRCGTSFLVFVLIISLLIFSFLGWPNLFWRITSRILLIPVIAGISYELLKWAGRCDNKMVKVLSYPGLMLQKLTTAEPDKQQLEVALLALKAVLAERSTPKIDGFVDAEGNLLENFNEKEFLPGEKQEDEPQIETAEEPSGTSDSSSEEIQSEVSREEATAPEETEQHSIKSALKWGQDLLRDLEGGSYDATQLYSYVTGLTTSRIITMGEEELPAEQLARYKELLQKRLDGIPLQYITGEQEFMGLKFKVNTDVLIPRFDTEVLAEKAINLIGNKNWESPAVLDMCTGSGVLGITIANKYPAANVTLADISQEALVVARENAESNHLEKQCEFVQSDMFGAIPPERKYDMIVCNPPYIESDVIDTLATEVKDHEPRLALDGGADGLDFYRILAKQAANYLMAGGVLALEIGYDQADSVKALLQDSGDYAAVVTFKDLVGKDRALIAMKK